MGTGPDKWAEAFRASMPIEYSERYSLEEIQAHAAVARDRSDKHPVRVGTCPTDDGTLGLCIVALDAPDLFSSIATALRMRDLDIVSAEAYTRRLAGGACEVLDVFRVRPAPERGFSVGVAPTDIAAAVADTVIGLLNGRLDPNQPLPISQRSQGLESADTRVRFIADANGALATLEVETDDRSGLLLSLAKALGSQQVSIVRSEVRTIGERVLDRFTLEERDGTPISDERRLNIQVSVLGAIQNTWATSS